MAEKHGHRRDQSHNERQLHADHDAQPAAVLLDIGLPKLSDHEVARQMRQQPWGQHMFLVALTGWGQEQDRQKSQEAGFNDHLVKPVEPATVMKLLAKPAGPR